jgi:hypothetical protein
MQSNAFRKFAILAFLPLSVAAVSFASTQNLTRTVSDDMCKSKHMMPGHSDADCARACAKSGSKYVLKGDMKQIAGFAGKRVSVSGDLANNAVSVQSITEAK